MDTTSPIASAFRLPTEPYPGLRPFLDYEAALLLGRGRQVREVIARLRETRFVAVIGGSGSGKSSLIRAGVVPDLRGFAIPDAGDYWIPVVWTPGTTAPPKPPAAGATAALAAQTPITRLAWKFSQLLAPPDASAPAGADEPDAAALRRAEIATVFRQGAGFSRLVDNYFDELPPLGPARERARFLFVVDQFEELFHPNNRGLADAKILVEAVIDHFFNPNPRCFVILTMRSEHLADCAGFLELPDAINKSSYLVRRLDDAELREAIVGPAKVFLRLQRRGAADGQRLPEDIVFDEPVIRRLLADVALITGDADHLPLLQHVLARVWEAASARNAADGALQLPARIVWSDLERAVDPGPVRAPGWLAAQPAVNTLRSSLENCAEAVYRERPPERRAQIDQVLRQLAFKDPNNGQYSQQRLDVDDPNLFGGVAQPRQLLRELLDHGFLDSVNYLFWDKENPQRVTLKVSHESFIRGWAHFRALVDAEADRFDEFVAVLRKCTLWKADENPELLLETSELVRFDAAELAPVFERPAEREGWFRVLLQYRDGERLAKAEPVVDGFIAASRARQAAEEQARRDAAERERASLEREREAERQRELQAREFEAESRRILAEKERAQAEARRAEAETDRAEAVSKRNFWLVVTAMIVAFVLLPYAAFAILIQTPVMRSVEKFSTARALLERRDRADSNPVAGAAGRELEVLLRAAALVEQAKQDAAFLDRRGVRGALDVLPPVADAKRLFAMSSSEPVVNGSLRGLLTSGLWRSTTDPARVDAAQVSHAVRKELDCLVLGPTGIAQALRGSMFVGGESGRGLFVPVPAADDPDIAFYAASFTGGRCAAGRIAWSVPRYFGPLVLIDARLRHMAVALERPLAGPPSVSLYTVNWDFGDDGRLPAAQMKFRSVVTDGTAFELVRSEIGTDRDASVPEVKGIASWREPGGTGVAVGARSWRVFDEGAQRIDDPGPAQHWGALGAPVAGGGCAVLGDALRKKVQPGFRSEMFQDGNRCFEIQRGNPPTGESAAASPATADVAAPPTREQVLMAVYPQPRPEDLVSPDRPLPAATASLVAFARLPAGAGNWLVGRAGEHEGWIALRRRAKDGTEIYLGAPWSTSALIRLGTQVLALANDPALALPTAPAGSPGRTPAASSPPPR